MPESTRARRKTLRKLGLALPAAWSAPLIQAVSLPAHGQTSPPEVSETDCPTTDDTDVIEGRSFACEDSITCTQFVYELEGGCLTRVERSCDSDLSEELIEIRGGRDGLNAFITVRTAGGQVEERFRTCLDSVLGESDPVSFQLMISGIPYTAEFTIGIEQDPATAFVSDIMVAPE